MEEYKLKKLDGENYHAWAIRARAVMVQKKCWEAIDPGYGPEMTIEERNRNEEALTLLFLIVEDTFLDDIGDCNTAKERYPHKVWTSTRIATYEGVLQYRDEARRNCTVLPSKINRYS